MAKKNPSFLPDFGLCGPNLGPKFFFREFYLDQMSDIVASYHCMQCIVFISLYFFNYSVPLPSALQTLRLQLGDCCRELTYADSQQPNSNWELLVFESKSLTSKLPAFKIRSSHQMRSIKKELLNFCKTHRKIPIPEYF